MKPETLAYIAGVIDSDGYFTIKRNSWRARNHVDGVTAPTYQEKVGIKQVANDATDLIHSLFGGYYRIEPPSAKNGKPLYSLQLTNKQAIQLVTEIIPYLRIKKRQAEILLKFRAEKDKGKLGHNGNRPCLSPEQIALREQMRAEVRALNDTRDFFQDQYLPP
jgi:hypothetical protein